MKKLFLILLVLFISTYGKVFSQDTIKPKNDFKIGIYSTSYMTTNPNHCCDTNNQPHSEPLWSSIYPTSHLNVLREDGFNIAIDYFPNIYTTKPLFMRKLLELFKNNNMQYIPHLRGFLLSHFFKFSGSDAISASELLCCFKTLIIINIYK